MSTNYTVMHGWKRMGYCQAQVLTLKPLQTVWIREINYSTGELELIKLTATDSVHVHVFMSYKSIVAVGSWCIPEFADVWLLPYASCSRTTKKQVTRFIDNYLILPRVVASHKSINQFDGTLQRHDASEMAFITGDTLTSRIRWIRG